MSKRDDYAFLNYVKRALMIPVDDTFADTEIMLHINTCTHLLISIGVSSEVAKSSNPLVEGLILIYVKTFFGFKNDGSVKELPSSFEMLVKQLALTEGEQ